MRAVFLPLVPERKRGQTVVIDLWALRCEHGEVTTDEVLRHFTPDQVLNRLVADRMSLPPETSNVLTVIVAMRSLSGLLLTVRYGCACGIEPVPLPELDPEVDRGLVQ